MGKNFIDKLNNNEFVVTAELCPPKGNDITSFVNKAKLLKKCVDIVNITDNQRAIMRMSSFAGSILAMKEGLEPILQVTCRDRNRIALQSDLLGASALGIKNVLALTGDYVSEGDHPEAKPVFDLDSVQLIEIINNMNKGLDSAGKTLNGKTDFIIGAAINPCAEPKEPHLLSFEKKISAGVRFFQTQAIFDIEKFAEFMDYAKRFPVKILGGILLTKSAKMAGFLNEYVPGVNVPDRLISRLEKSKDPLQTGIEIAREQIEQMKDICHGVHVMTVGKEELAADILK